MKNLSYKSLFSFLKSRELQLLLLFILLGSILRFAFLSTTPPLMHYDEASYGYNAWSISETGRDEFGNFLPANIRAFDDWRPPLYTYILAGFFRLTGPQDVVIRYPSMMAGILLIVVMYFFAKEILGKKYGLPVAFLTALNPALIIFSRAAFDATLSLTFTVLALWLFLFWLRQKNIILLSFSIAAASLAMISYQATKIFLPSAFLVIIGVYHRSVLSNLLTVWKNKISALIPILIIVPFVLAVAYSLTGANNFYRFTSLSIFNDEALVKKSIAALNLNHRRSIPIFDLFTNRRVVYFEEATRHYLENYNPAFLFAAHTETTIYQIPNLGNFYLPELFLFIIGLTLFQKNLSKKLKVFLSAWFLLAALPSALLAFGPQVIRMLQIIPVMIFVISLGLVKVWEKFKWPTIIIYLFCTIFLIYNLFILLPQEGIYSWMGNYPTLLAKAENLKPRYDQIMIANSLQRPYIFFLWYTRFEPMKYLERGRQRGGDGMSPVDSFDKYTFNSFSVEDFKSSVNILFIGKNKDFPNYTRPFYTFDCQSDFVRECIWFVDKNGLNNNVQ